MKLKKKVIVKQAEVEAHTIVNDAYKKQNYLQLTSKTKQHVTQMISIQNAASKKKLADGEKELRAQALLWLLLLLKKALRDTMTKDINDSIVASVARS